MRQFSTYFGILKDMRVDGFNRPPPPLETFVRCLLPKPFVHFKSVVCAGRGVNYTRKMSEFRSSGRSIKPPNILIYSGHDDSSILRFSQVKNLIRHCINQEAYTVNHLKHEQLFKTPWQDNAALLILTCVKATPEVDDAFYAFLKEKANMLCFQSSFESKFLEIIECKTSSSIIQLSYKEWNHVNLLSSGAYYRTETTLQQGTEVIGFETTENNALIAKVSINGNKAILCRASLANELSETNLSQSDFSKVKESNSSTLAVLTDLLRTLGIDCSAGDPPKLTSAYLLASDDDQRKEFVGSYSRKLKDSCLKSKGIVLCFDDDKEATETILPVKTHAGNATFDYFDPEIYWKNLQSKSLGRVLLYTDVIPTTMTVLDGFMFSSPKHIGVIAIAGRQTSGRGRGGNSWLSPLGCAMFSLHVRIDLNSPLGQKSSFLQHIVSLAVVQSVQTLPNSEDLPLKIKWPNDIYFNRHMKLGGVIVNSSMMGSVIHAVIGCGFNVSNSNPTICINDIIKNWNTNHETTIPLCTTEQLIARTVTHIEQLIDMFQTNGADAFCRLYYKHWIHSGDKVKVESLEFAEVTVHGLDDFGFLQVKLKDDRLVSLQPDGNSFDIMHNLIAMKRT